MPVDQPETEARADATPETTGEVETSGADEPRRRSALLRLGICAVLLVLLVAAIGVLAVRFLDSSTGSPSLSKLGQVLVGGNPGRELASQREEVMATSDEFLMALLNYGPQDLAEDGKSMPGYRDRVRELATAKMDSQFLNEGVPLAEATVAQQGAGRKSDVFFVGVAGIDEESATVLAVGLMENSYPEKAGSDKRVVVDQQLFRYKVELVKNEGEWLVDSFGPVVPLPAGSMLPEQLQQPGAGTTGNGTGE